MDNREYDYETQIFIGMSTKNNCHFKQKLLLTFSLIEFEIIYLV